MTDLDDGLEAIKSGMSAAGQSFSPPQAPADQAIGGLRTFPVRVGITVVPVRDGKGRIETMNVPDSPALEFEPPLNQG